MSQITSLIVTLSHRYITHVKSFTLSAIELYNNQTKLNISSIAARSPNDFKTPANTAKLAKILTGEKQSLLAISIGTSQYGFSFTITTSTNIFLGEPIYVRIKGDSPNEWPDSIDVAAVVKLGSQELTLPLYSRSKLLFPRNLIQDLVVFNTYLDTPNWSSTLKSAKVSLNANKKCATLQTVANNQYPKVLTDAAVSSGKWYFELTGVNYYTSSGFAIVSDAYSDATNDAKKLGSDDAGQSIAFTGKTLLYKNSTDESKKLIASGTIPTNPTSAILSDNRDRTIGILLDLDNKLMTIIDHVGSIAGSIRIPWSGATRLAMGKFEDASDPFILINWGQYPFKHKLPESMRYSDTTIKPGFGKEVISTWQPYVGKALMQVKSNALALAVTPSASKIPIPAMSLDITTPKESTILNQSQGWGYIKSKVIKGPQNVPISTILQLVDIEYNIVLATTWSDGKTGEFEFRYLPDNRLYNVIALDPDLGWVSAINGPIKPARMPGSESRAVPELYP